ncbi:MAG: hypothetical protein ACO31B_06035, partial [Burkholderiaceae bacterium]
MHALNEDITGQSQLYFLQTGTGINGEERLGEDDFLQRVKVLLQSFQYNPNDLRTLSPVDRPACIKLSGPCLQVMNQALLKGLRADCKAQGIDLVVMAKPRALASYKLLAM